MITKILSLGDPNSPHTKHRNHQAATQNMLFYLLACCATMIIVHLNLSASATQRSLIASFLELRELAAEMEELKIDSSHLDESLVALDLLLTAWRMTVNQIFMN
ncbi:hypothetical protein KEM48_006168 [Puccinia striiformis f. sp. tritici PST-130]|nr:hypothetical protein KEM48_006168 [Puccinia striiformis f. sp. tritici PST-130]